MGHYPHFYFRAKLSQTTKIAFLIALVQNILTYNLSIVYIIVFFDISDYFIPYNYKIRSLWESNSKAYKF